MLFGCIKQLISDFFLHKMIIPALMSKKISLHFKLHNEQSDIVNSTAIFCADSLQAGHLVMYFSSPGSTNINRNCTPCWSNVDNTGSHVSVHAPNSHKEQIQETKVEENMEEIEEKLLWSEPSGVNGQPWINDQ
jgi:hypothetical protein